MKTIIQTNYTNVLLTTWGVTPTPQKISHNHIKIKRIKIIGQKHENIKSTQFYQPICIRASIGLSNTTTILQLYS